MKLLDPTSRKRQWLDQMAKSFACGVQLGLDVAQSSRTASRAQIHQQAYTPIRRSFGLPADYARMAINEAVALARSFYGLRKSKRQKRTSFPRVRKAQTIGLGVQAYQLIAAGHRFVLRVSTGQRGNYIWLPLSVPPKWRHRMRDVRGDGRLFQRGDTWFVMLPLQIPTTPTVCDGKGSAVVEPTFMGVDLGIVRLATVSTPAGVVYFRGKAARQRREHLADIRRRYQRHGRRDRVKQQQGKEQRWMRHRNHVISKRIVELANQQDEPVIVLENLQGIRERVRGTKRFNRMMASWTFRQLVDFVCYKADRVGIPVIGIDPRGTSKTCRRCGHSSRANRPTQSQFRCVNCHHQDNADGNASGNIAAVGARLWQHGLSDKARLNATAQQLRTG